MSQQPNPQREDAPGQSSLSEISHLFLTGIRDRATGSAPRPNRKPPVSIDVTHEEFASSLEVRGDDHIAKPSLSLIAASHLGQSALKSVRSYARQVAISVGRAALIELGDDGLRITCLEGGASQEPKGESFGGPEPFNATQVRQTLEEMSWDIQTWLIYLPTGSEVYRNELLGHISQWTLLAAADDQGIISAYRALKGLTAISKAKVSLANINAEDDVQAGLAYRKLSGAAKQFLNVSLEDTGRVRECDGVAEQVVLWSRCAAGEQEHWKIVADLARRGAAPTPPPMRIEPTPVAAIPAPVVEATPAPAEDDDVLDVSSTEPQTILAAITRQKTQWLTSSIAPPMCAEAVVAVDREGRLTLLAVAAGGLAQLSAISRAFSWLTENRLLVKMALPQMNVDAAAMPKVVLFADQADLAGHNLSGLIAGGHVTIQTYRRLRWGAKTGLLLQAA